MTMKLYPQLIASSLAYGLLAFAYYIPGQSLYNSESQSPSLATTPVNSSAEQTIPDCSQTQPIEISAFNVRPELMIDWGFPERPVSAASR
jgi:hypothetical protein